VRTVTANQRQLEAFRRGNVLVAENILADPEKYPPGSLMAIQSRMVLRGGVNIRRELEARAGLRTEGMNR
jgi:hypothetical protein